MGSSRLRSGNQRGRDAPGRIGTVRDFLQLDGRDPPAPAGH
jgi:hypothetical protein